VKVVEKPLRRRRDKRALPDILGQGTVGALQDAGVVPQARIDAAGVTALRIDREIRGEGERPLIEALRAERFLSKRLIADPIVVDPRMEEQVVSLFQINASFHRLRRAPSVQLWHSRFARWA